MALTGTDARNMLLNNSRGFCELRSSMGQKVYYYIFDHDIPGGDAGSFHGSDLWFMFDSLGNSWRPFEGKHYDLAPTLVESGAGKLDIQLDKS